jgi:GDPmannose 4,6-dehydratase
MTKIALITGISGQDGSYLAELLLSKNYRVIGIGKQKILDHSAHLQHLIKKIEYFSADLSNNNDIQNIIQTIQPNEVYNLASQSYPGESWNLALETAEINALGAHRLFDAVKKLNPNCKVYQASSSEMYGDATQTPQDEHTPFKPLNPYAVAKVYAHNIAKVYRQSYGMFISCGILFNHESPRRGTNFITQKVTYAAACIKLGIQNSPLLNEQQEPIVKNGSLLLGNLDAKRDWGYAGDYVDVMWRMLQHDKPDDYVIGTGKIRTIRQLCETAFSYVGLDWEKYVKVDSRFVRPTETGPTVANPAKAKEILGWEAKVSFNDLIAMMVDKHVEKLSIIEKV